MKKQIFALIVVFLSTASFSIAESQQPGSGKKNNGTTINVFDDDFFAPKKEEVPTLSPGGRVKAEEPSYNSAQRQEWLSGCEKYKENDPVKYKTCFNTAKSETEQKLKESFDEVEKKQMIPLKSAPNPLIEEQMKRNPGSEAEED